jgi:hypothetical protein
MIKKIAEIEDRSSRTQAAKILVDILKQLNPNVREQSDNIQRIWDHLHLMSEYTLNIDGPFPPPNPEFSVLKPERLNYKMKGLKFKHYGRNLEFLVDYAVALEDENERLQAIAYIGRLIKNFYTQWSKEALDDNTIIEHLKTLSEGKITLDPEMVKETGLFEGTLNGDNRPHHGYHQHGGHHHGRKKTHHFNNRNANNRHKR